MPKIGNSINVRPAKQETYLPGNVIGFKSNRQPGGISQIITLIFSEPVSSLENLTVSINQESSSLQNLELWLFGSPLSHTQADNTPLNLTEGDLISLRVIVSLSPYRYKGGVTFQSKNLPINIPYIKTLFGVLVVRDRYVAKGGESFLIVAI